jgi:hypothetical protein
VPVSPAPPVKVQQESMILTMLQKQVQQLSEEKEKILANSRQSFNPMDLYAIQQKDQQLIRLEKLVEEERKSRDRGLSGPPVGIENMFAAPMPVVPVAAPAPRNDSSQELMLEMMKAMMQNNTQASTPVDPMTMMLKVMEMMRMMQPQQPQTNPAQDMMLKMVMEQNSNLQNQLTAVSTKMASPEKRNGLDDLLATAKAITEFRDILGKSEPQASAPTFGDILMGLIENAPAVGEGLGKMMASRTANTINGATLPHQQVASSAAAPSQPPVSQPVAMPVGAQQAMKDMAEVPPGAANDEKRIEALAQFLVELHQGGEPWTSLTTQLQGAIVNVDSRPELRALVAAIFKRAGAIRLGTDEVLDAVTDTIHRNYSPLYKQLTGGKDKRLIDWDIWNADGSRKGAPVPAQAPVVVAATPPSAEQVAEAVAEIASVADAVEAAKEEEDAEDGEEGDEDDAEDEDDGEGLVNG